MPLFLLLPTIGLSASFARAQPYDWTAESNLTSAHFGASACTAGDVNGDGYSDLIVGAPQASNGQSAEGMAFVYLGSPTGLEQTPSWFAESNQALAFLGTSVTCAGDVNGDGYDDILIGAPFYDHGQTSEGLALLFLGSADGLGPNGTPTNADWSAEPNQASVFFGTAVGFVGDLNDDGLADIAVGAPSYSNGESGEGAVFIYHGNIAGPSATPSSILESNHAGAGLGVSISGGNFDGGLYNSVLAGAPQYRVNSVLEGAVYLFRGGANGAGTLPPEVLVGTQDGFGLGSRVACLGDLNGDGYADAAFSIGGADAVDIYRGGIAGLFAGPPGSLSLLGNVGFGEGLGTAGDVNGDGTADLVIGVPRYLDAGLVEVYQGLTNGSFLGSDALQGEQAGEGFGAMVIAAGDVNGDGLSDLVIGSPDWTNGESEEGRVVVQLGSRERRARRLQTYPGNTSAASFASALCFAGDIDADGFSDIVAGEPDFETGGAIHGRIHVYMGAHLGAGSQADVVLEGFEDSHHFGAACAGAGDVNGDGYDDVLIGAPGDPDSEDIVALQASLYYGSGSGLDPEAQWAVGGFTESTQYGSSVSSAGDVNGDGFADILVGARYFDANAQRNPGRAFLYLGTSSRPSTEPDWDAIGSQNDENLGHVVCSAGDLNGDGYSDFAVSAPGRDDLGAVDIYLGGLEGPQSSPDAVLVGDEPNEWFGIAVAHAGDVNGDGFSDLLVTSKRTGPAHFGRVRLYLGSAAGIEPVPAWTWIDELGNPKFAFSLSSAGDVDLDGYGDFIVSDESGTTPEGQPVIGSAWLWYGSPTGPDPEINRIYSGLPDEYAIAHVVAGGGDVDGDASPDLLVGHPGSLTLRGEFYTASRYLESGPSRSLRMTLHDQPQGPLAFLGKGDSTAEVRFFVRTRSPAGRDVVAFEVEGKEHAIPLDGTGVYRSNFLQTAPVNSRGSYGGVAMEVGIFAPLQTIHFRWRYLTKWPFAPRSSWFALPYNSPTEWQVRTGGSVTSTPEVSADPLREGWIASVGPNPMRSVGSVEFRMPDSGRARIDVVDAAGRRVAGILDTDLFPGSYRYSWNGTTDQGDIAPSGVYFFRLSAGSHEESAKVVVSR